MRLPLDNINVTQGYHAGHQAYDLAAGVGTPVKSTVSGVVTAVGTDPNYFGGLYVIVRADSDGFSHYTGHHSAIHVSKGQRVTEGQHIANIGATGQVTGPHTHFQIRNTNGNLVPQNYYYSLFSKPNQGGEKPMTPQEETEAYQIILERNPDSAPTGRSGIAFIRDARYELGIRRKAINDQIQALQTALANEQGKPPKEIVKEVQVIVEKLVEKPVYVENPATQVKLDTILTKLNSLWGLVLNLFRKKK